MILKNMFMATLSWTKVQWQICSPILLITADCFHVFIKIIAMWIIVCVLHEPGLQYDLKLYCDLGIVNLYASYYANSTSSKLWVLWWLKVLFILWTDTPYEERSCCGSVDKTTDSQSWGPRFKSAGSGSSALRQGTSSSLPSPLERT